MAFDQGLAERIRRHIARQKGLTEKRMFGGLAFLLNGNMCCGVHQRELIVRLDPAQTGSALAEPPNAFNAGASTPLQTGTDPHTSILVFHRVPLRPLR